MFKSQRRSPNFPFHSTRYTRFYPAVAALLLGVFVWSVARPLPVQGQIGAAGSRGETPLSVPLEIPDAIESMLDDEIDNGEKIILPDVSSAWEDDTWLDVEQVRAYFEELLYVEATGEFQFSYQPNVNGGTIRALPVAATEDVTDAVAESSENESAPPRLYLAWVLGGESTLPLPAGQRVDVEWSARLYSPPAGATLSVREQIDGEWRSSSVVMEEIQWMTYALGREISPDAQQVHIALVWEPQLDNAWVELALPGVIVDSPVRAALFPAPTDTPTPEPTPTPDLPPTPTATPEPAVEEEVVVEEPADEDGVEEVEAAEPTETPTPTYIVVTSTPTPEDVFEEATRVALATAWAPILGTATPTPENLATPTDTPTPFLIVVTNTPVPENAATATYDARLATAIAFTTGTPTPYPEDAEVLLATNTPPPAPTEVAPTHTPTPVFVYVEDLSPTATPEPQPTVPFPSELLGKILFLSDFRAPRNQPNVMIMNPDGSGLGIMTSRQFYNRAVTRDVYSADRRFRVYVQREGHLGGDGRWLQIKFEDSHYDSVNNPISFFDNGHSWSPVWSPARQSVAFVSNDTDNDEIYLVNINEWPPIQLTNNDWEWDHHPSFSPDGSQIVFMSNRNTGTRQIWIMDAGGGNQRQITNFPFEAWNPVWVKYPDS